MSGTREGPTVFVRSAFRVEFEPLARVRCRDQLVVPNGLGRSAPTSRRWYPVGEAAGVAVAEAPLRHEAPCHAHNQSPQSRRPTTSQLARAVSPAVRRTISFSWSV